jgi:prepilin-type N-terminal cleavage/methylation domain-containing protein
MRKFAQGLRAGFTLLEVMVSTAIMVVIVLTVVTIAADTMRVYDRAVADLSTQSEARGVLDAMENDFSTAVIRADGRCWMEIVIPGGNGAPTDAPVPIGGGQNVHQIDQPIVMLFSTPADRPRWSSAAGAGRRQLRGDVCAVAYRIGHRSPFDMPGEKIQQVYGVYRTVVDPENTFNEALKEIMDGTNAAPTSPWNYWTRPNRTVHEYAPLTGPSGPFPKPLINASPACWTLDEQNFIASNVVAMNLILWCSSSLPAVSPVTVPPANPRPLADPLARGESVLRPVFAVSSDTRRNGNNINIGGYGTAFKSSPTPSTNTQTGNLRYAPPSVIPTSIAPPSLGNVHPHDLFLGRLRVYSNRLYPDNLQVGPPSGVAPLTYMPYTVRGVEISLTLLTPEGSKELRGLQSLSSQTYVDPAAFRRIVFQHGRNFTRYVRVLANGG